MKKKLMVVLTILSLLLLVGCNKKPNKKYTDIDTALDAIVLMASPGVALDLDNVVDDFVINARSIGYDIIWTTNLKDVKIENNQVIIKKILEGSYNFELKATIKNDQVSRSKIFLITVKPNEKAVIQDVTNKAKPYVEIVYYGHDNANNITRHINLPTVVDGVVGVSWASSDSSVINPDNGVGYVTRGEVDVNVILTASLYYRGQLGGSVNFDVWVKGLEE